jgi:AcrR family transcriptional regulator
MTTTRRPRADARRNYERLLTEADAAFRERGVEASLESIARAAGVAIGTLYGHFPSRRSLVGALLRERNEALFELGDGLAAEAGPDALGAWVRAVTEHAATYSGLAAMLANGLDDEASELHASCLRLSGIGERLSRRLPARTPVRRRRRPPHHPHPRRPRSRLAPPLPSARRGASHAPGAAHPVVSRPHSDALGLRSAGGSRSTSSARAQARVWVTNQPIRASLITRGVERTASA